MLNLNFIKKVKAKSVLVEHNGVYAVFSFFGHKMANKKPCEPVLMYQRGEGADMKQLVLKAYAKAYIGEYLFKGGE